MADQCMRWDVAERPSFSLLLVALINFMQDFCVLGRPNLTTDIQDHLFRFFTTRCNFLRVQLSTVDICKSSEKESLRETRQADERRRAKKGVLGRLGGKTEDGKIRKEGSGERRRKGKGMSSLLSSVQSPWHPFRHSYLAASAHPARQCQQMDHAWCVWRQASHAFYAFPKHFC